MITTSNVKKELDRIYILGHLGLGDHIICNGLYREYYKKFNQCLMPVRKSNYWSVRQMLSDLKNFILLPIPDFLCTTYIFESHEKILLRAGYKILKLGYYGKNFLNNENSKFAESFYDQAGIDFSKRWESFYCPRNIENEKKLFELYKCEENKYIFLHEDLERNYLIKRDLINSKFKVISPDPRLTSFNFFDYRYLIENAAEVHCMESSFWAFIESINIKGKKFAHRYARHEATVRYSHETSFKSNWIVYK
jgi:hypothetical protein